MNELMLLIGISMAGSILVYYGLKKSIPPQIRQAIQQHLEKEEENEEEEMKTEETIYDE